MTLSPLESRISTLRREARAIVTNGPTRDDATRLEGALLRVLGDPLLHQPWLMAPGPARTVFRRALVAAEDGNVGGTLLWLEQCAAHLASERMPKEGGCFGARR